MPLVNKSPLKGKLPAPKAPAPKAPAKPVAKAPARAASVPVRKPTPRPNAGAPSPRVVDHSAMAALAFAGIKDAKMGVEANYERPGHYIERIDAVKLVKNRKGGISLAIEKTILAVLAEDPSFPPHRVGESVSHLILNHGGAADYFLPDTKRFVSVTLECDPEAIDMSDCVEITDPKKQPLAGFVVECNNLNRVGKESGKDFTKVSYKRRVRFHELTGYLDEDAIELLYPNGELTRLIEEEGLAGTEEQAHEEAEAPAEEQPAEETEEQAVEE